LESKFAGGDQPKINARTTEIRSLEVSVEQIAATAGSCRVLESLRDLSRTSVIPMALARASIWKNIE
jgi:hypothetical protein